MMCKRMLLMMPELITSLKNTITIGMNGILKANRIGSDYYWLVDEERNCFIGEISICRKLTDNLKCYGGHIGYGIRFSQWKKGYGTLMLRLALEKAKKSWNNHRFNCLR